LKTYAQDLVDDYVISKYAGSQNKLGLDYESYNLDLDVWDEAGAYHIFSVARRLKAGDDDSEMSRRQPEL
jgi:hypothetical protein